MKQFSPSATNAINAEMARIRKSGIRVYNLGSGDPVVPNHPAVLAAVQKGAQERHSPYAPVGGLLELRQAAAEWMHGRYQSHYSIEHTIVTCGGKFALFAALEVLLDRGDEVLFASPYWPSYPDIVKVAGGVPKPIPVAQQKEWKLTPAMLSAHITGKTKVFLFNNACNPTGTLYTKEEVEALLETAWKAGLYILSDEVYSEIVYDGRLFISAALFPKMQERVIVVESLSKNFAMAGYRVGFAFAPPELVQSMIAVQSHTTTGTALISQKAALAILAHARDAAAQVRDALDKRRRVFFKLYNELFGTDLPLSASGLYLFAKTSKSCEEILKKASVALVPGEAFGMEGYARFAFSEKEEEIIEALKALRAFLRHER